MRPSARERASTGRRSPISATYRAVLTASARGERPMAAAPPTWQTVKLERADGIAWVTMNRPEKRNAMNPTMNFEMNEVLDEIEVDPATQVVVLTGAGDSWSAGMDLREYFRALDDKPKERKRAQRATQQW